MHSTPNSTPDASPSVSAGGNGASNVRSWAGHRQAFPLGQAHTPLTSMPTLGRALTDGSLSEVDYVNTFLQRLAQHSGPADDEDDDSGTEDDSKFEEEEDEDPYAPSRDHHHHDEEEEDDYYHTRRKRRTRWRPSYPRIKKTKRHSDPGPYASAARTRRASVCVPAANGNAHGGNGVPSMAIRKRRSNSVSSYFAMRSAESSPSTPTPPSGSATGSPPMDSPIDDRLSPPRPHPSSSSSSSGMGYPAYAYRQAAMERLPEWMMARPCEGDALAVQHAMNPHPMMAAMMMQHHQPTAFIPDGMQDYPHPHQQHQLHAVQGMHHPSLMQVHPHHQLIVNSGGVAYASPARPSTQEVGSILVGEDEVLASSVSSPSGGVPPHHHHHQALYPTTIQMPLLKQEDEEDEMAEVMHPGILEPSPEEGEWLDDLLRLNEHSSSTASQGDDHSPSSSSSSSSVQHPDARHSSAKDPIYAELFGY